MMQGIAVLAAASVDSVEVAADPELLDEDEEPDEPDEDPDDPDPDEDEPDELAFVVAVAPSVPSTTVTFATPVTASRVAPGTCFATSLASAAIDAGY